MDKFGKYIKNAAGRSLACTTVVMIKTVEIVENTSHFWISIEVSINCKKNYQQNRMRAAIGCTLDQ